MKVVSLKVGAKSKSQRQQLALSVRRPENVAECLEICHQNEAAVSALFTRGYTIWLQDRFGRPMFEAGDDAAKIQGALDAAIPGTTKGASQKRQVTIALPKGQKSFSPEEVALILAKAGATVVPQ